MVNPFTSVTVQPSYGRSSVFITWTLAPGYEGSEIYVYRSPNGVPVSGDWELLNENSPVTDVNFYTDPTFYDVHDFRMWHYRLLLVKVTNTSPYTSQEFDSPIIGMFSEALRKTEYGLLYTMRRREYLRMRSGNGVRVFHCIPSTSGKNAPTYDPMSGKNIVGCGLDESMGTVYDHGYRTIFQTWAEIMDVGDQTVEQMDNGAGFDEVQKFKLRLLAFPHPEPGHLIVLPCSDHRYIIDGTVKPYLFKGFLPVAYEVEASLLYKAEQRHMLDMPTLLDDPSYPIYFNRAL